MLSGKLVFPAIESVVYGTPAAAALVEEAERLKANRVFLMVSRTMNRTTGEVAKVRDALGNRYAGVYDSMPSHTPRDAVLDATRAARAAGADLIVTFGGGSLTDAGKVVRIALQHGIDDLDGFDAFRFRVGTDGVRRNPEYAGPSVPQVSIPTTLSAGDFNASAGCTDTRTHVKHSFRHPSLGPRIIILDPAPTVHTPLWVWLSTGIRALDHATEGICSQFASPVSDMYYVEALKLLAGALPRVKRTPADLDARLDCLMATWLSTAGRVGGAKMGASHAIGHALGGTCGVPHGYTSCVMLPHVLRYNRSVNAERQALVAASMGHPGKDAADVISAFLAELGLPRSLREVDVTRERFDAIVEHTMHDEWLHANPRKISSKEQVLEILDAAA
jgi:maleylacetate reductase